MSGDSNDVWSRPGREKSYGQGAGNSRDEQSRYNFNPNPDCTATQVEDDRRISLKDNDFGLDALGPSNAIRESLVLMTSKVLFLHGFGARPGGFKPTFLRKSGYEVVNPGLPDDDFDASLRIAKESLTQSVPDVVVASSRGGAVALGLDLADTPCVLIAPAWKRWGSTPKVGPRTIILHSARDETIPLEDSRELVRQSGLGDDALVVVGESHFMADEPALKALLAAIEKLIGR